MPAIVLAMAKNHSTIVGCAVLAGDRNGVGSMPGHISRYSHAGRGSTPRLIGVAAAHDSHLKKPKIEVPITTIACQGSSPKRPPQLRLPAALARRQTRHERERRTSESQLPAWRTSHG